MLPVKSLQVNYWKSETCACKICVGAVFVGNVQLSEMIFLLVEGANSIQPNVHFTSLATHLFMGSGISPNQTKLYAEPLLLKVTNINKRGAFSMHCTSETPY